MGMENLQSKIENLKSKTLFPVAALGVLAILSSIWWLERNAHLRSEGALQEIQRQTKAEISALRTQADAAVRDANESNARAVSELEASRRLLQTQSQDLRQKLATLETAERNRVEQVAALPAQEIWKRLGEQLGEGAIGQKESEVRSQVRFQVRSGSDHRTPEIGESEGKKTESRNQNSENSGTGQNSQSKIQNLETKIASSDSCLLTTDSCSLTELGARQVETALVELDSCREQSSVQFEQLGVCQREGVAEAAMVEQQKSSIAQLNLALQDKDKILAKRETEFKAEMKVARGTWVSRLTHVAEHVAIGVAIGFAIR